ncbi:DUF1254 domain-containing protein [Nocardia yamanashiensis]|uniref:DUF1254 domain-containing protein n=1 Tax=Nocardia yamanashiensis TaxID=209247 RepID=UPI00082F19BB|nr:DUF1254 domain-containing protein [Nocardia yamanashiensis]
MDSALSRRAVLGLAAAAGLTLTACSRAANDSDSAKSKTDDPVSIAADAYVFGYPLVLMHATKDAFGPVNRLQHARDLPDADDRLVVRMNTDTLYSLAWLDLSEQPLVLTVPAVEAGRYWIMQLLDAWTNTVHDPSSVNPRAEHAGPPFAYLITGPGWTGSVPAGLTRLDMPTPTVWLLGRIQVNGPADLAAVHAVQDGLRLDTLAAWTADPAAPTPGEPLALSGLGASPAKAVAALDGRTFFDRLCTLMAHDAPAAADAPALKRFATIGIRPGGSAGEMTGVDLDAAAAAGRKAVTRYVDPRGKTVNGWRFSLDVGVYGTDYETRAGTAMYALGANLARDAVYPTAQAQADDNGTPRRFRIRFPAGQFPPVDAFWSLTAYDADSFLVSNAAQIYSVGHDTPLTPGPDGSAEVVVQAADPGPAVPRANWLPIPVSGPFSLTLRLYAPRSEMLDGRWSPPALEPVT